MKRPKISIIIPARNEEELIGLAIKKILNQTYSNFEIIVSNDGSTDKTQKIVEKFIKKDKRIKILNRKEGHSAAFARNRGAEAAKGEIFLFLDADTYINKFFLEAIAEKYGEAEAFITINFPVRKKIISRILTGFVGPSKKIKLQDGKVYDKNSCHEAGMMFFVITKKAYKKIKGYNEKIFYYEDEDFAKKFYEAGFKSILVKKANQYFELPSTMNEFFRQCSWMGKGTNTIQDKNKKRKHELIWFLKSLFLIFPLFFLWDLNYFLIVLMISAGISYIGLVKRNRKLFLSLVVLPFLYIKTFLVTYNILKFWK